MVISQFADGQVASRYGELAWDWTPYSPSGEIRILNFCYWGQPEALTEKRSDLVSEIRWLMYCLISRSGARHYTFSTLAKYMMMFRRLATHCEKRELSVRRLLADAPLLWTFITTEKAHIVRELRNLFGKLARIGSNVTGYPVPDKKFIKAINVVSDRYVASLKQHSPLPTRIYSHVISVLSQELTDFQLVAQNYLDLTRECVLNPLRGRGANHQSTKRDLRAKGSPYEPAMPALLDEFGLTEYFRAKGLNQTVNGLSAGLRRILTFVRLTIQAFSGMRDSEISSLMYGCLEERHEHGRTHYVIHGTTTKLNGGRPKKTRWITSREGARAIEIARQITSLNRNLFTRGKLNGDLGLRDVPLLASVAHLGLIRGRWSKSRGNRMLPGRNQITQAGEKVRALLRPALTEEDLCELEQIDPHRAWRSEQKFQLGVPWNFTSHQLRRSLALYAQRSGLVSLPSLRRQLQHITEEMSRYYAKGSAFAKDFIRGGNRHFSFEWRETQSISSALSYIQHVLLSDDVLFGGHGNWIEHRLRDRNGEIEVDRGVTLKRFDKGEIAYRETNLGGCTKIGPCDKRPIRWLNIDCVKGCLHLVGRLKMLERVIVHYTKHVATLDPSSTAYQSEKADLDVLVNVRDRVRAQSKGEST
ncbi:MULTISPECIES: hypothetical protein [Paraburkholderia]|uniref:hypothetical protein n=1 Tax=Paraburkholderia TaxID=1822464 RepID=UPI0022584285|nr:MULTISPECIES: hypothetical protein [Paraburkholderia]MCX4177506.1 hypothetical protein [Paraburkholderia madseniana]MDQ6465495.1 hypothetical protein [Paraburkholderia madseniana]